MTNNIDKIKSFNTIAAITHVVLCVLLIVGRMFEDASYLCISIVVLLVINSVVATVSRYLLNERSISFFRNVICESIIMCIAAPAIIILVEYGEMNLGCFLICGISLYPYLKTTKNIIVNTALDGIEKENKKKQAVYNTLYIIGAVFTLYCLIVEIVKDIVLR